MSPPRPMRVLVVGDPYMPVSAYADALTGLAGAGPASAAGRAR